MHENIKRSSVILSDDYRSENLYLFFIDVIVLSDDFFFFQAEDGIRDIGVTGVQTCALPISALEKALGELEGGLGTAFSSGMAATHALLTAATEAGAHVVLPNDLYGGTYRLVDKVLTRFGLRYDLVDQTDPANVERAITPETRLIWVETPTNPLLNVVDIAAVVALKRHALVAVDNTFATPVVQRPLELGADAVVHSTTKYLGGHSDVVGGAVIVQDPQLHGQVRFVQNAVGAVPGPFDAFLVHRGLRTLHLRVAAHTENARQVVDFLRGADGVSDV